jgi:hypothetical protein
VGGRGAPDLAGDAGLSLASVRSNTSVPAAIAPLRPFAFRSESRRSIVLAVAPRRVAVFRSCPPPTASGRWLRLYFAPHSDPPQRSCHHHSGPGFEFLRAPRCRPLARVSGDRRGEVKEEVAAVRPTPGDMNGAGYPATSAAARGLCRCLRRAGQRRNLNGSKPAARTSAAGRMQMSAVTPSKTSACE